MTAMSRTVATSLRSTSRTCLASSSRLPHLRNYATPSEEAPLVENAPVFGTTTERRNEGAIIKKMRGPGVPFIPSLRHVVKVKHAHLWGGGPFQDLTIAQRKSAGRSHGRIATRHRGGGFKRRLRNVDFYRHEGGIHDVVRIEFDPGRTAHIALIHQRGTAQVGPDEGAILAEIEPDMSTGSRRLRSEVRGGWSYILAPDGLRAGDTVSSYRSGVPKGIVEGWGEQEHEPSTPDSEPAPVSTRALGLLRTHTVKPGNVLPLYLIPPGTVIHNIALDPKGKMSLCRAAGTAGQIVAHHGPNGESVGGIDVLNMGGALKPDGTVTKANGTVLVKLKSGEVRKVSPGACATVGSVSNKEHQQVRLGTAGKARRMGRRPITRGTAMNTVDHPHGGGRGKSKGNKQPHSIWGWVNFVRTRRPKDKDGNKMVVTQRPIRGIVYPGPAGQRKR